MKLAPLEIILEGWFKIERKSSNQVSAQQSATGYETKTFTANASTLILGALALVVLVLVMLVMKRCAVKFNV